MNNSEHIIKQGVYAIIDGRKKTESELFELAKNLLWQPITALQIRAKCLTPEKRKKLTRLIHASFLEIHHDGLRKTSKPVFIVNDDITLAKELGAGLHLGQGDMPLKEARKILGDDAIIGISTHSIDQALEAQANGASYIGFGPIYHTQSKQNALPPRKTTELRQVLEKINIPVVAIGGIEAKHFQSLADLGVKHFALISALDDNSFFKKIGYEKK